MSKFIFEVDDDYNIHISGLKCSLVKLAVGVILTIACIWGLSTMWGFGVYLSSTAMALIDTTVTEGTLIKATTSIIMIAGSLISSIFLVIYTFCMKKEIVDYEVERIPVAVAITAGIVIVLGAISGAPGFAINILLDLVATVAIPIAVIMLGCLISILYADC